MLPPPPQPPPMRQVPTWVAMWLGGILVMIGVGISVLVWPFTTPRPIDAASTSRPSSASDSSGPAFDPTASAALAQIAAAFSTSVAPTPTPLPPTPTYAVATEIPPVLCGTWARIGESCQMPPAPAPTATPLSDCPVAPRLDCIWRGSLTPQPTPDQPWAPT